MAFSIANNRISEWLHTVKPFEVNADDLESLGLAHNRTVVTMCTDSAWQHVGTTAWQVICTVPTITLPSSVEVRWPWAESSSGLIVVSDPAKVSTNFVIRGIDGNRLAITDTAIHAFSWILQTQWVIIVRDVIKQFETNTNST